MASNNTIRPVPWYGSRSDQKIFKQWTIRRDMWSILKITAGKGNRTKPAGTIKLSPNPGKPELKIEDW